MKAVAGFMNAHGGTLLIGVNDNRRAIGLDNDYKLTKKGNHDLRDSFENWLTDLFDRSIGKPALANVSIALRMCVVTMFAASKRSPVASRYTHTVSRPWTSTYV